ncbi:CD9 antigen isoform X2 [Polyodon spathula]|uniref:CD9 antigen isoform X2 n=1 Tax=Polyodon spathula TaxID=7913 RepID=UPI001B7EDBFB|nr:CD9 antigen isoform X2 [Polyodon spathula]
MAVDGCGQCCKVLLVIFNIIFAVVGLAMLGLGLWLRFSSETRGFFDIDLNTQSFIIGVIVLISTGALMLLVAILGHCGLCNESRSTLGTFLVFVGVLCGAEIAAGVLAFVNKDALVQNLSEFYQTIYLQYLNKRDPSQAVTLRIFHNASCLTAIANLFNSNAPVVLWSFIGIAVLLIVALICCHYLSRSIRLSQQSPSYIILQEPNAVQVAVSPPPGFQFNDQFNNQYNDQYSSQYNPLPAASLI